jgi:hypothetical protein
MRHKAAAENIIKASYARFRPLGGFRSSVAYFILNGLRLMSAEVALVIWG